jgi:hypothetical protein
MRATGSAARASAAPAASIMHASIMHAASIAPTRLNAVFIVQPLRRSAP